MLHFFKKTLFNEFLLFLEGEKRQISNMAQQVKALAPEFNPQNPPKGRRELTPPSRPLCPYKLCDMSAHAHKHTKYYGVK